MKWNYRTHTYILLVMSPSRVEGFSARLGSAHDLTSARNRKSAENEPKFDSQLKTYFQL